ncbi:helix-turn-helix transcriptional regulator [Amycolatopsis sp. NPDC089917]|uniref:helix-turn-helix domain-containing protein n=1 Tax=Amycolatopsis sp. NPDC089917 TaxID=3155187 RepID=UPI0034173552
MDVPEFVRLEREKRGWTQKVLAARTGVSVSAINRIERERHPVVSLVTAMRLGQGFQIDVKDLLIVLVGDYRGKKGGWDGR